MATKLTTAAFIEKARAVHGDTYDYSRVEYSTNSQAVTIICAVHGAFEQRAANHLLGRGCRECAALEIASKAIGIKRFVERARAVHGDKYDYSQTIYTVNRNRISIICTAHGAFSQFPALHLKGYGCPCCVSYGVSTAHFIEQARAVHGDKYDYSKVEYTRATGKVRIFCLTHGEFSQSARAHVRDGSGCPKCAHAAQGVAQRKTFQEFLESAATVHGLRYSYCNPTEEFTSKSLVAISCAIHGQFHQSGYLHIKGAGCPTCARLATASFFTRTNWLNQQKGRRATLYIVSVDSGEEDFFKVGITFRGVSRRFSGVMPYQFKTVATFKCYDAGRIFDLEHKLHKELRAFRYHPKFSFGGETECFSSILPILELLPPETFFLKNRTIK